MFSLLTIIVLTALTSISSIIPVMGKVVDNRRKGIKKFTKIGFIFFGVNSIIIVLQGVQYLQNQMKEKESTQMQITRDALYKAKTDSALLALKSKFDSSNTNAISTVTKTLGVYGYKFDSTNQVANQRIVRIVKDSSKAYQAKDPVLMLCGEDGISFDKLQSNNYHYKISFCSLDASSSRYNIHGYLVLENYSDSLIYYAKSDNAFLEAEHVIASNQIQTGGFYVDTTFKYKSMYIYFKGSYKNYDGSKTYPLDIMYYYTTNPKSYGMIIGDKRKQIKKILSKKPIISG